MPPSAPAVLRRLLGPLLLLLSLLAVPPSAARAAPAPPVWRDADPSGSPRVHLYFFWSQDCPHCLEARPEIEALAAARPWLVLHSLEVTADPAVARTYAEMAEALGQRAQYVPGLALCGRLHQGYPGRDVLERELLACHAEAAAPVTLEPSAPPVDTSVTIPLLGRVDASAWSLPVTTLVLAGLDAFNPCAFFVLLFLLSLLVRVRSRARMILVSGVFILFSGLWYFVFMAAWLNAFLWVGELRWVTLAAGVLAAVLGVIDIKDFFLLGKGPSRSIPARAKPSLMRRMRKLVQASSLGAALAGTVVLAGAANTYELLCTAGFPMVYTRVLTLAGLSSGGYYLWLAIYNAI
jgi:hypothetical protein